MKKMTMDDIAREMNISKSLVSLALANKYGVSEEMRSKIKLFALTNGYDFSQQRSNKKPTKSVMIFLYALDMIQDEFWSKIISGIEFGLNDYKFNIELISSKQACYDNVIHSEFFVEKIISSNPDAVVILGGLCVSNITNDILKLKKKIILIDSNDLSDPKLYQVNVDNYHGGYNAANYLFSVGHRNLCFVGNINYSESFNKRYLGFKKFCEEVKLANVKYIINNKDPYQLLIEQDLIDYLKSTNEHIAISCANDPTAFIVYKICRDLGLTIGKDISVLGFDDINSCTLVSPKLSSMHVPKFEIGKKTASLIANIIDTEYNNDYGESIILSARLSERDSVAILNKTDN